MSKTRIVEVDRDRPDPEAIAEAAHMLRDGKLVVFPTETVYGLGAHALDPIAVQKIFDAKERPSTDPLIVHIAHIGQVNQCAAGMPAGARKLGLSFWAGPLTLILQKKPAVPDLVTAGLPNVALRVPSHRVARALMETAGIPIAAPSANRFSKPSPTSAAHVIEDLDGRVDLILDGGPTDIGLESTIVDFTVDPPVLRRPGGITFEQIHSLVPEVIVQSAQAGLAEAQIAPGQMTRHYAPRAEVTLYEGPSDAVVRQVADELRSLTASGHRVGVLAPQEDLSALAPEIAARAASGRIETIPYGSRADLERCGRELFASMRQLDATGVAKILAVGVGSEGLGRAIHDRLMRAAEGKLKVVVKD
ncbi:MAG TPA: L-threonylcarbamoyladenylate synthase [Vicinamibacterales bacterium]|nr:L-threonylcarbamoyladenylate synthase [Vicinamibacterales bacterium]